MRQTLGIGDGERRVRRKCFDTLRRSTNRGNRLAGDGQAREPRGTERGAGLAVGETMNGDVQDVSQNL